MRWGAHDEHALERGRRRNCYIRNRLGCACSKKHSSCAARCSRCDAHGRLGCHVCLLPFALLALLAKVQEGTGIFEEAGLKSHDKSSRQHGATEVCFLWQRRFDWVKHAHIHPSSFQHDTSRRPPAFDSGAGCGFSGLGAAGGLGYAGCFVALGFPFQRLLSNTG